LPIEAEPGSGERADGRGRNTRQAAEPTKEVCRMTAHRPVTAGVAALVGVVALGLTTVTAGTARAHGAPTDPVSRVAACGPEGVKRTTAACRAAVDANGGSALDEWDNLRVADVRGRDREVVPDGQLCSAGLEAYRGLDIARADWPTTTLRAGAGFTLTYRSTIPHKGTFSLYLTKEGYDPAAPLRWSDLAAEPFATATDPELADGAYRITGRLPAGLTGRHVLYTVWRNTDTPDTYYSCSDVVLAGEGKPVAGQPAGQRASASASASASPVSSSAARDDDKQAVLLGGAAAVLALGALGVSALLRLRRRP
jgi:predicted carbohydrate-binding protein with CBM5 and CBM33 domain